MHVCLRIVPEDLVEGRKAKEQGERGRRRKKPGEASEKFFFCTVFFSQNWLDRFARLPLHFLSNQLHSSSPNVRLRERIKKKGENGGIWRIFRFKHGRNYKRTTRGNRPYLGTIHARRWSNYTDGMIYNSPAWYSRRYAFVSEFAWHIEIKSAAALTSDASGAVLNVACPGLPVINSCQLMDAVMSAVRMRIRDRYRWEFAFSAAVR